MIKEFNIYGNNNAMMYKDNFTAAMYISKEEALYHAFNKDLHRLNIKTDGNNKLKNTRNTRFLIWNIPEIACCPGNCEHKSCEDSPCYAFTNSLQRGLNVQRSRIRNYLETINNNFVDNMIFTIENLLKRSKPLKDAKKIYFRIHEAGDFYSKEYLLNWYKIATHFLHSCKKLVFQAYTHSYNCVWFTEEHKPRNFRFRKSDCNNPEDFTYTVVKDASGIPEDNLCKCDECGEHCHKCYEEIIKQIFVVAHTVKAGNIYRKAASRCAMSKAFIRWINLIARANKYINNGYNKETTIKALIEVIYS